LAVETIAAFKYSAFQSGCACLTSAAMPAVCGVAIEVPELKTDLLPVPIATEAMLTPGAVTSGLKALSPERGPNEVKLASCRYPGLSSGLSLRVTVLPATAAACSGASVSGVTPRNGIVTL